jgi:hypothetical protein
VARHADSSNRGYPHRADGDHTALRLGESPRLLNPKWSPHGEHEQHNHDRF